MLFWAKAKARSCVECQQLILFLSFTGKIKRALSPVALAKVRWPAVG